MPQPGVLRPLHQRYRRAGRQRGDQLRLPAHGGDVPTSHRALGPVRPPRYRDQPNHVRGPLRPAPHRAGAGHGDQADPQGDRPRAVRGAPRRRRLGRQVTPSGRRRRRPRHAHRN